MMVSPMQKMSLRVRRLLNDRSGLAAVEFAMIFPMMVVMFFGVLELSAAISVDRKATLVARTLSDLTSQMVSVANADLVSFGEAAKAIMTPYPGSPLISSVTEVYVDSVTGVARVQWSKGLTIGTTGVVAIAATAPHNPGDVVVLPTTLVAAKGTYVIWSEVSLHLYAGDRLYGGEDRHDLSRCRLHASAHGSLCYISDGCQLHLSDAVTAALSDQLRNCTVHRGPSWKRVDAVFSGLHWFRLR